MNHNKRSPEYLNNNSQGGGMKLPGSQFCLRVPLFSLWIDLYSTRWQLSNPYFENCAFKQVANPRPRWQDLHFWEPLGFCVIILGVTIHIMIEIWILKFPQSHLTQSHHFECFFFLNIVHICKKIYFLRNELYKEKNTLHRNNNC